MAVERSLILIKPDAVERNPAGAGDQLARKVFLREHVPKFVDISAAERGRQLVDANDSWVIHKHLRW